MEKLGSFGCNYLCNDNYYFFTKYGVHKKVLIILQKLNNEFLIQFLVSTNVSLNHLNSWLIMGEHSMIISE